MRAIERQARRLIKPISRLVQAGPLGRRRLPRGYASYGPGGRLPDPASVTMPDLIGMSGRTAVELLRRTSLGAVALDERDLPTQPDARIVVRQRPEPGRPLPAGFPVRIWLGSGPGSAGDREPRQPAPISPARLEEG